MPTKVVPFKDSDQNKTRQVEQMFDEIAPRYDYLNHLLSMNIDKKWRKKAVHMMSNDHPKKVLDVATGTGDFAIDALRAMPELEIVGIDISAKMLEMGEKKLEALEDGNRISLRKEDSEAMSFPDDSFDAITCGFGVRNFDNLHKGLGEMLRVLVPGGKVYILEFSRPKYFPFKQLYSVYFRYILPSIGNMISKSKTAYSYLPESVAAFPDGDDMLEILENIGFKNTKCKKLTLGIASIYSGEK